MKCPCYITLHGGPLDGGSFYRDGLPLAPLVFDCHRAGWVAVYEPSELQDEHGRTGPIPVRAEFADWAPAASFARVRIAE